ncbi:hypothetical protein KAR91_47605 [Candidatus Pacearchaeota archaeon]|nr:hypothetical protein [Candidatus Pacearchaeota archaeon]
MAEEKKQIDPEIAKIQAEKMKHARMEQRAKGGPPVPGPKKPMTKLDAIAQTVMKNAQDVKQLQETFGKFAQQTEQSVMVTQRAVQNLARPDLILGPVIEQWHNGPYPDMILSVKEGMRIVAVGEINRDKSDDDFTCIQSEQGLIFVKNEYVIMTYEKEEGKLYGQARRDSEIAAESAGKSSEGPKDPAVETKKG